MTITIRRNATMYIPFDGVQGSIWKEAVDTELQRLNLKECDVNMLGVWYDIISRYCFLFGREIERRLELEAGDGEIELDSTEGRLTPLTEPPSNGFERLLVSISSDAISRLFKDTKPHLLRRAVHERFDHCYAQLCRSTNVDNWLKQSLIDWDEEELYTLLLAWLASKEKTSYEMEYFICLHMVTKGEITRILERRIIKEGEI